MDRTHHPSWGCSCPTVSRQERCVLCCLAVSEDFGHSGGFSKANYCSKECFGLAVWASLPMDHIVGAFFPASFQVVFRALFPATIQVLRVLIHELVLQVLFQALVLRVLTQGLVPRVLIQVQVLLQALFPATIQVLRVLIQTLVPRALIQALVPLA